MKVLYRFPNHCKITKNIKDEHYNLLKSTELFEMLTTQELTKNIEGEIPGIKTIFLIGAGGRIVKNAAATSKNLLVNSASGTGKDWVVQNVLKILPKECYIKRTRITANVFTYWHNPKFEPEWTWDDKVFYCEDISSGVLNADVFKVMASGGSQATVLIHQTAFDIEIRGKPTMIITTANSTPNPELIRRFPILFLTETQEQTKGIMQKQAKFAAQGKTNEINKKITEALEELEPVDVKVPFAEKISEKMASEHIIMRTSFTRFLDYIKFSCALHQLNRQQDEEGFFLAEKQDYEIACEVFKNVSTTGMIPLTKNQKEILLSLQKLMEEHSDKVIQAYSVRDISLNLSMSMVSLYSNLGKLHEFGFVSKVEIVEDGSEKQVIGYVLASAKKLELPTVEAIFS